MRTETVTRNIYKFDELTDRAKENAREWWRQCENEDSDVSCVYEDAERVANILGITLDQRHNGPTIYYSGFCSQGDGACFEGSYRYAKGASKAIREYARLDTELHAIADALQKIQAENFYQLTATMEHSGQYYHSGCMSVNVERDDEKGMTDDAEDRIKDQLRLFAGWIYNQLEKDYDYRMSAENVDESIRINEYEFTENGGIA